MNMTLAGVEVGYPERTRLPNELVPWDVSIPPGIKYGTVEDKLVVKGLEIPSSKTQGTIGDKLERIGVTLPTEANLVPLARASNDEIKSRYGDQDEKFVKNFLKLRSPFGRTGLNGVGIFYEAGQSKATDTVVLFDGNEGLKILLVNNRGRYNTPGMFFDDDKISEVDASYAAVFDETGIHIDTALMPVLSEDKASVRTTDLAWLNTTVNAAVVNEKKEPKPGDRETFVAWKSISELPTFRESGELSDAKFRYINEALAKLGFVQIS